MKAGISFYFRDDKVRMRIGTMEQLGCPDYIHLLINEEKKQLFIEKCGKDLDSFHIVYHMRPQESVEGSEPQNMRAVMNKSCYINSKRLMRYLAGVINVPVDSPSLRFEGQIMPDGRIFIDLSKYTVIPYKKDRKYETMHVLNEGEPSGLTEQ